MNNRRNPVILPFRQDMPRVLRVHQRLAVLANWCSWRVPFSYLALLLLAHSVATPRWWQIACDFLIVFLIALLFCSYGLCIATSAALVERQHTRFESVARWIGILGGFAFAAAGCSGMGPD